MELDFDSTQCESAQKRETAKNANWWGACLEGSGLGDKGLGDKRAPGHAGPPDRVGTSLNWVGTPANDRCFLTYDFLPFQNFIRFKRLRHDLGGQIVGQGEKPAVDFLLKRVD